MNTTIRVIPRLDIKGPNLVKGIHLEGLRVLGKPEDFARFYYESGADELIYIDVVASLFGRNNLLEIVERTSQSIFIPLTVGGGIRNLDDIKRLLRAGADKVAINTAAINDPDLIRQASEQFGSSTIVVTIETIKHPEGEYFAYTNNGRESTGVEVFSWARRVAELGAGEIMLTSIDQEGTGRGYDMELTRRIAESVGIPVIASGGPGRPEHVRDVVIEGKADAVAVASIVHYDYIQQHVPLEGDFSTEGNVEFLKSGRHFSKVSPTGVRALKSFLVANGIHCRYPHREGAAL